MKSFLSYIYQIPGVADRNENCTVRLKKNRFSAPHPHRLLKYLLLTGSIGMMSQLLFLGPAIAAEPDLTLTKSHTGSFSAGGLGLYTFTVNNIGTAPSSGVITVTDTLPNGMTVNDGKAGPVATSGTNAANWTCSSNGASPQVITCQTSAVIVSTTGSNASTFKFYVDVSSTATGSLTNTAIVSGGGETNTSNNSYSDPTSLTAAPSLTCGTLYGVFGSNANSLQTYNPNGSSLGSVITTLTGVPVVTLGIAPSLDLNGKRRIYYLNGSGSSVNKPLYYYDGSSHVNTNIIVPNNPNRMGFSPDGILYMSTGNIIYRYDPSTNALTSSIPIADNPNNTATIASSTNTGDLAFDINGVMYLVTGDAIPSEFRLYRVDGASGSNPIATLLDTAPTSNTTTSLGFAPDGQLYLISNAGQNWRWNLATGTLTTLTALTSPAGNGYDLASCSYPTILPQIIATKTVAKFSGSSSSTSTVAGDVLEYTIMVRNVGSSLSSSTTLQDSIPTGTTYVGNSTTMNTVAVPDVSGAMPFATAKTITGPGQTISGSLIVDSTPSVTTDNEVTVKFKVKVNASGLPSKISNRATVQYTGAPSGGVPTDDPNASGDTATDLPIATFDYGDAPDSGGATGTGSYKTLASNNGPVHEVVPGLKLGATVTGDTGLLQSAAATADTSDDAFTTVPNVPTTGTYNLTSIPVTNTTGSTATLYAWVDFNKNGKFEAGEYTSATVANNATTANLSWTVPAGTTVGNSYARFRLTTQALTDNAATTTDDERSFGVAINGEVEDYPVTIAAAPVVTSKAKLILVKRITAIKDGVTGTVTNYPGSVADTNPIDLANYHNCNWPTATGTAGACTNTYITGATTATAPKVNPGDEIEYTIYYLNGGTNKATAKVCDQLNPNLTFQTQSGSGIGWSQGGASMLSLTNIGTDGDKGQLTDATVANCNLPGNSGTEVVVVDVGDATNPLIGSTGAGVPTTSYGYIRFKALVK